jgi:hypothetical protein
MITAYRIAVEHTSAAQAVTEMREYHYDWLFRPQLRRYVESFKLVLVQILIGNVVLRDLMGVHLPLILTVSFLHSRHRARFKGVPFFNQLINAFRIRLLGAGQAF